MVEGGEVEWRTEGGEQREKRRVESVRRESMRREG
jgi:hypothetical protein